MNVIEIVITRYKQALSIVNVFIFKEGDLARMDLFNLLLYSLYPENERFCETPRNYSIDHSNDKPHTHDTVN